MTSALRPTVDLSANCACGAVSVRVTGRVKAMIQCACLDCQRATGTGHSSVALVDAADLSVSGETRSFARTADSGATFTRHFCPACGTPIHGQSSRAETTRMLPVGLFGADSEWFMPNQLIFARSHHDWDLIADSLPHYQTYRDQEGHA